jgi:hypothetical protein
VNRISCVSSTASAPLLEPAAGAEASSHGNATAAPERVPAAKGELATSASAPDSAMAHAWMASSLLIEQMGEGPGWGGAASHSAG